MNRNADIQKGRDALLRGDPREAERLLSGAATHGGPDEAEALKLRAQARVRLGVWGGAADDLERYLKARPDEASPLELEYARVLRLAQSLDGDKGAQCVADFNHDALAAAVTLRTGTRSWGLDDLIDRASLLASDKYAAAPPENLQRYLAAKIPGRLYRVPALQALPPTDAWAFCEWWVLHGVAAADAIHEFATGQDAMAEPPQVPPPPYRKGVELHDLAARCPMDWAFVHHALISMAYDLADELADEQPQLRADLPAIRDSAVKPLIYIGFGVGLEAQGV